MDRYILNGMRERVLDRGILRNMPEKILIKSLIMNTWGTNAIEGNTLTLEEVTTVIEKGMSISNHSIRDMLETIQHSYALEQVIKGIVSEINMKTALELHHTVFYGILKDAGQWRTVNVRASGSRHSPPGVEKILTLLQKWEKEYISEELSRKDVFSQAADMHYGFESIHPFSDGNGRVGRLLLNIHFLNHNWPLINIIPYDRSAYLLSFEDAHLNGTSKLQQFLEVSMARSLVYFIDMVGTEDDKLMTLKELKEKTGTNYSTKYLALRISQGELPAIMLNGEWKTSETALKLYTIRVSR
ncbi:MAG: Fic family protein [Thermoplasmataceae archaeon]